MDPDSVKGDIRFGYENFPEWKEDSDRLFGPEQAKRVWSNLSESGFLPPLGNDILVMGVSENIPTHLVAIWRDEILSRRGKVNFIAGDMGRYSVKELLDKEVKPYLTDDHHFSIVQWDAENLPVLDGKVNVIFDRAGWLWHCAREFGDQERLLDTLIQYYKKLTIGGIVVIDSIDGFGEYLRSMDSDKLETYMSKLRSETYLRPSEVLENPPGQYQPSTVDAIKVSINDADYFWNCVSGFFEIHDIGEGVEKVRILKKKI